MEGQPIQVGLIIGQLTYGGAESQVFELARGLARRHAVTVYCLSDEVDPYGPRLERAGVRVRSFPARGPLDVTRALALGRALRADGVEVAHAFLFIASAYAYLATRFARRTRFVASARNCKVEPHLLRRHVMKVAFRRADAVICNSVEVERFAHTHYDAAVARSHVVYNGVDADRFAVEPRPHAGVRIGTVGRIEAQKNLDLFLGAAKGLIDRGVDATFEVAGTGTLSARLESTAQSLGLGERVRFVGSVADIPAFLAGLDQFWLTSDWEGTPNVVLEAMAAGLPVIATAVGGTPEILSDGRTGVLVSAGDEDALVAAAVRLAGDPGEARRLGADARAEVRRRFSIAAMVAATEGVYRTVLED